MIRDKMIPMPEYQIAKLPKWAQSHILDLERQLRRAEEFADSLEAEGVTEVMYEAGGRYFPLPAHARVRFTPDVMKAHNNYDVSLHHTTRNLQVFGQYTRGTLVSFSTASNVIHIKGGVEV